MAGRRRTRSATTEPAMRHTRQERRRAVLNQRWASATSTAERFTAAYDYARGAHARRQPDPAWADALAEQHARGLVELGDQLLAAQAKESLATRKEAAA